MPRYAFIVLLSFAAQLNAKEHQTTWVTADTLMPRWGFYPLRARYGGTRSLGKYAAWCAAGNKGQLTWIANIKQTAKYHVWVRKYAGYGNATVFFDEQPVAGGRGGGGGARYGWFHLGLKSIAKGQRHIDIKMATGMLDAILLTTNDKLHPANDKLPPKIKKPTLSALREYRQRVNRIGFWAIEPYGGSLYDWRPKKQAKPIRVLKIWGAANQYLNGSFAISNKNKASSWQLQLDHLSGPKGTRIKSTEIDLRVVHVRHRVSHLFEGHSKMSVPEILLRNDQTTTLPPKGKQGGFGGGKCFTTIPPHQSRQIWITVHLRKGVPSGIYRGNLQMRSLNDARQLSLAIQVEALPLELKRANGYYGIYYPSQSVKPKRSKYVSRARYLAELQDQVRHGLNTTTLYGGFTTLELAQKAGMHRAPCLMHWPSGAAPRQVAAARKMGFDDLYYYGVDEPTKKDQIERCRKEAERRLRLGVHMFTAINSAVAQRATRDFVDRPVYNIYVFGGPKNQHVQYVRKKGFQPVSYWVSATCFPLPYRALTGLYNRACGYLGSSPWSYQDDPSAKVLYDPNRLTHKMSYPDENGMPIPTLAWEAHRAGIDDVRYLEALDGAIARANKAKPTPSVVKAIAAARAVRKQHYESIGGRYFQYLCSLKPGDLRKARRAFADATVELLGAVSTKP